MLKKLKLLNEILINKDNEALKNFLNNCSQKDLIKIVLLKYEILIKKVIHEELRTNKFIPLTFDDVFNSFLGNLKNIVKKYQPDLVRCKFSSFLVNYCAYYCKNLIRYWSAKKRQSDSLCLDSASIVSLIDETAEKKIHQENEQIDLINFKKLLNSQDLKLIQNAFFIAKKDKIYSTQKINIWKEKFKNKVSLYFNY
ncbi:hypothetical protein [Mycoplasmopsis iners]|uniref:hypothetical protein n=1 Tax=Mycoplasmopsis iners TaxID=76630 RepID=UPI0004963256|nr:hypothetical protein [Mycoplasmopsis iners]